MDHVITTNHNDYHTKASLDIADAILTTAYKDPPTVLKIGGGGTNQMGYVRRLTPLECERLQGFPDGWTDIGDWTDSKGKVHKAADSPRYRAIGNSIALPFWEWMAKRMVQYISGQATMGSLFSGIGGFELVFQRAGATPVWSSEIDEYCIAVTKERFKESENECTDQRL